MTWDRIRPRYDAAPDCGLSFLATNRWLSSARRFLSRVSIPRRDTDMGFLSVRLSVTVTYCVEKIAGLHGIIELFHDMAGHHSSFSFKTKQRYKIPVGNPFNGSVTYEENFAIFS